MRLGVAAAIIGLASGNFLGTAPDGKEDVTKMEDELQNLVMKGDDEVTRKAVEQMANMITKTLIPARQRSHESDQTKLKWKAEDVKHCSLESVSKRDMNAAEKVATAKFHKDNHDKHVAAHGECLFVQDGKNMVKDARCHDVDAAEVCRCDAASRQYLNPSERGTCKDAPAIKPELRECCDSFADFRKNQAKCLKSKHEYEYAAKQHELIMKKQCADYDACYDRTLKAFNSEVENVKKSRNAARWNSLNNVQCLVNTFKNGKVTEEEAKACKEKETGAEGIDYPEAPAKETCVVSLE